MNELALFSGGCGGILGGKLLGWRTRCAVEVDAYCRSITFQRQRDGILEPFPIWDDVQTFDGYPWRGHIDIVTGGFPCQDLSAAGKGAGLEGSRSGLWRHMARIIGEVRPQYALVENSPMLTSRGLGTVLGDLASMGYNARWGVLSAADAIWDLGNPVADHLRERIWVLAVSNANSARRSWAGSTQSEGRLCDSKPTGSLSEIPNTLREGLENRGQAGKQAGENEEARQVERPKSERCGGTWWETEPRLDRVASGIPNQMDRIRAIGNSQIPAVVRLAWETLSKPSS